MDSAESTWCNVTALLRQHLPDTLGKLVRYGGGCLNALLESSNQ
jgi:hypothetical protein